MLHINIPLWKKVKQSQEKFVQFQIETTTPQGRKTVVWKRYSDFVKLNKVLHTSNRIPLPPKSLFFVDNRAADKRRNALVTGLKEYLARYSRLESVPVALLKFLDVELVLTTEPEVECEAHVGEGSPDDVVTGDSECAVELHAQDKPSGAQDQSCNVDRPARDQASPDPPPTVQQQHAEDPPTRVVEDQPTLVAEDRPVLQQPTQDQPLHTPEQHPPTQDQPLHTPEQHPPTQDQPHPALEQHTHDQPPNRFHPSTQHHCHSESNLRKPTMTCLTNNADVAVVRLIALREGLRTLERSNYYFKRLATQIKVFGSSMVLSGMLSLVVNRLRRGNGKGPSALAWGSLSSGACVMIASAMINTFLHKLTKLEAEYRRQVEELSVGVNFTAPSDGLSFDLETFRRRHESLENAQGESLQAAEDGESLPTTEPPSDQPAQEENATPVEQDDQDFSELEQLLNNKRYEELFAAAKRVIDDSPQRVPSAKRLCWGAVAARSYAIELKKNQASQELVNRIAEQGVGWAKRSVQHHANDALSHKWFAILTEEASRGNGTKAKIEGGIVFYEHTKKALALNPTDPTLHYMMGKFQFAVANLSWVERRLASSIFGAEPPKATLEESVSSFKRAGELRDNGPAPTDLLEIGRVYKAMGDRSRAVDVLGKASWMENSVSNPEDEAAIAEAKELLAAM